MTTKQGRAEHFAREAQLSKRWADALIKARDTAYNAVLQAYGFEPDETDWDEIPVWLSMATDEADRKAEEAAKTAAKAAQEAAFKAELEIFAREYAEQYKRTFDAEKKNCGRPLDVVSEDGNVVAPEQGVMVSLHGSVRGRAG